MISIIAACMVLVIASVAMQYLQYLTGRETQRNPTGPANEPMARDNTKSSNTVTSTDTQDAIMKLCKVVESQTVLVQRVLSQALIQVADLRDQHKQRLNRLDFQSWEAKQASDRHEKQIAKIYNEGAGVKTGNLDDGMSNFPHTLLTMSTEIRNDATANTQALEGRMAKLEHTVNKMSAGIRDVATAKTCDLENGLAKLQQTVSAISAQLEDAATDRQVTQTTLRDLAGQLAQRDQANTSLRQHLDGTVRAMKDLESKLDASRRLNTQLQSRGIILETRAQCHTESERAQSEKAESAIRELTTQVNILEAAKHESKQAVVVHAQRIANLRKELAAERHAGRDAKTTLRALQLKIDAAPVVPASAPAPEMQRFPTLPIIQTPPTPTPHAVLTAPEQVTRPISPDSVDRPQIADSCPMSSETKGGLTSFPLSDYGETALEPALSPAVGNAVQPADVPIFKSGVQSIVELTVEPAVASLEQSNESASVIPSKESGTSDDTAMPTVEVQKKDEGLEPVAPANDTTTCFPAVESTAAPCTHDKGRRTVIPEERLDNYDLVKKPVSRTSEKATASGFSASTDDTTTVNQVIESFQNEGSASATTIDVAVAPDPPTTDPLAAGATTDSETETTVKIGDWFPINRADNSIMGTTRTEPGFEPADKAEAFSSLVPVDNAATCDRTGQHNDEAAPKAEGIPKPVSVPQEETRSGQNMSGVIYTTEFVSAPRDEAKSGQTMFGGEQLTEAGHENKKPVQFTFGRRRESIDLESAPGAGGSEGLFKFGGEDTSMLDNPAQQERTVLFASAGPKAGIPQWDKPGYFPLRHTIKPMTRRLHAGSAIKGTHSSSSSSVFGSKNQGFGSLPERGQSQFSAPGPVTQSEGEDAGHGIDLEDNDIMLEAPAPYESPTVVCQETRFTDRRAEANEELNGGAGEDVSMELETSENEAALHNADFDLSLIDSRLFELSAHVTEAAMEPADAHDSTAGDAWSGQTSTMANDADMALRTPKLPGNSTTNSPGGATAGQTAAPETPDGEWIPRWSESMGAYYYVNAHTGVPRLDNPYA